MIPGSFVNKSTRLKVLCSELWKSRSTSAVCECVCEQKFAGCLQTNACDEEGKIRSCSGTPRTADRV